METLKDNEVDFLLTDIPYDAVSRSSNGLRNLNKEKADIITFDLDVFLGQAYRITKNSICIFCGKEQFSSIYSFFATKKGTVRPVVWEKTNPSPMNGQYIYLSGVELAVWFKKSGAKVFNAHCKNTVFKFPSGKRTFHPTQKNLALFEELIRDNTNEGDIVFDPCMGSGTTAVAAIKNNRRWVGCELDPDYYTNAKERIMSSYNTTEDELKVTQEWCNKVGIKVLNIVKSSDYNGCDTVIKTAQGDITVEVKQDELWRFSNWHQYGIDMISVFKFKPDMSWDTKVHQPVDFNRFLSTVDIEDPCFKWGKVIYSIADIWIFYTKNYDGSFFWLEGYNMKDLRNEINLPDLLAANCCFARNSKRKDYVSGDWFHSACFFVDPKLIEKYRIKSVVEV